MTFSEMLSTIPLANEFTQVARLFSSPAMHALRNVSAHLPHLR